MQQGTIVTASVPSPTPVRAPPQTSSGSVYRRIKGNESRPTLA